MYRYSPVPAIPAVKWQERSIALIKAKLLHGLHRQAAFAMQMAYDASGEIFGQLK